MSQQTDESNIERKRAYDHARYLRTKEMYRDRRRGAKRPYLQRRREMLNALKRERGCADCGYNTDAVALDFDHPDGDKRADVARLYNTASLERLMTEIAKCEVVCANCHRIRTAQRAGWPESAREA